MITVYDYISNNARCNIKLATGFKEINLVKYKCQ